MTLPQFEPFSCFFPSLTRDTCDQAHCVRYLPHPAPLHHVAAAFPVADALCVANDDAFLS